MNIEAMDRRIQDALVEATRREGIEPEKVILEIPRDNEFGDLASNVALTAAGDLGVKPIVLARRLAIGFPHGDIGVESVEVAGAGFLNFRLAPRYFHSMIAEILASGSKFGASEDGRGARWLLEYVSANPTGPLNIVSARAASIGDSLARILNKRGFMASSEFYVNDRGRQVALLGESILARLRQIESGSESAEIPEGGYHGEYVADLARYWLAEHEDEKAPTTGELGAWAANRIRADHEATLKRFRVEFDRWFRESEVYEGDKPHEVVAQLKARGCTYHKDGAVYFTASRFDDSADRVLVTSDGRFTYVVPDIAYHIEKRSRGFDAALDLLGPDHHGHILQIGAGLKALDIPQGFFKALIVQQVNLKRGAEEVKVSKRAGVGITLEELLDEVGVDAARFYFLRRKISSPLDFDIELAKRHTEENPVYYVQYAHARIMSILRQPGAFEPSVDAQLSLLTQPEETAVMRSLARFPWTLAAVARGLDPHLLTSYLVELARVFHLFYHHHRVIGDDAKLTAARLALSKSVEIVLKEGLNLIGVDAPEKM